MSDNMLTYSDVHCILAALDGWPRGQIHLRLGELDLHAMVAPVQAHTTAPFAVKSSAVGTFTIVDPVQVGAPVRPDTTFGVVAALGRETPIPFDAGVQGTMIRYEVLDQSFVEYGQTIAMVELEAPQ